MAKRSESWKASQLEKKRKARRELRQQRGYDASAYRQKDAERTRGRASTKTKESYRERVRKYEERTCPKAIRLGKGIQLRHLRNLKEFTRWFIESTKGRLADDGRPTKNTINVHAQEFVPGFVLETGNEISSQDATELYYWIENELVEEGVLSTTRKPKYNFKLRDFERAIIAFWATNDPFFTPGRYRVQFHFITLRFLCTGSRVPSFTPASVDKVGRGLRYKDCDKPIYSGGLFLLALALADNVLYGFSSPEEVFEQRIPEGQDELFLRWNEDAKNRCTVRKVRKVRAAGASEDPLTKEIYAAGFRKILANACHFVTATVHAMRRALGAAGYSQFHEHGLPRRLPIEEEQKIDADPQLVTKATEIRNAESDDDIKRLKRDYNVLKRRIYASMYQQFQSEWAQNQRDWKY
ncbi:hypothetical protein BDV36DRAFT_286872 [Aspergillus pseudocaelatus]|uniref:Uncharacterized protein n=1 Tax=Aspergillus pseudocaelatus TaxID=1825620 RepID=A0ABQ6WDN1_9EURO|nr:hypothetical protein BDV36DRAFT_286872 [Aspergillus pseudocaelatus]